MINYKIRKNSDLEEQEAKELASEFHKKILIKSASVIKENPGKEARDFHYDFFEEICLEQNYNNLILAHHLSDQLERFLMQLSRGVDLAETLGIQECERRSNYTLLHPLFFMSKDEILNYLKEGDVFCLQDESNEDEKYFRNCIRKSFSNVFVSKFHQSLKRSFFCLDEDRKKLCDLESIKEIQGLMICPRDESLTAKAVKMKGLSLSATQRKELLKGDCALGGRISIAYRDEKAIVFRYETCQKLPKEFKKACRIAKIPRLLRAYLYNHKIDISSLNF